MKVKELIALLAAVDQDADVYIEDADTAWYLLMGPKGVHHKFEDDDTGHGRLVLSASYYDELNSLQAIATRNKMG